MEAKKTSHADLGSKSTLFFYIGLVASLSIVITAFEFKDSDEHSIDLTLLNEDHFEEILNIPPTDPPLPPPPVPQQRLIEVVEDNQAEDPLPNIDIASTEQDKVAPLVIQAPVPEVEDLTIHTNVEEPASPKEGLNQFYQFLYEHIKYPPSARRMNIQGKVFVEFVIAKDGSIDQVHVIKGIGYGCDEEVERVMKQVPAWNPGKQRGRPVIQRMVIPVTFKMQ